MRDVYSFYYYYLAISITIITIGRVYYNNNDDVLFSIYYYSDQLGILLYFFFELAHVSLYLWQSIEYSNKTNNNIIMCIHQCNGLLLNIYN